MDNYNDQNSEISGMNTGDSIQPSEDGNPQGGEPSQKSVSGKKRIWIFAVCFLLLAVMGAGIYYFTGIRTHTERADPNSRHYGVYNSVSHEISGMVIEDDGDWLELKEDGKAVLYLFYTQYSTTWEADGNTFKVYRGENVMEGEICGDEISLQIAGTRYVFRKGEKNTDAAETFPSYTPGQHMEYWILLRVDSDDPDMTVSKETVQMRREVGDEMYLYMNPDGTGIIDLAEPEPITWNENTVKVESFGETFDYEIEDGCLKLYLDGAVQVFAPGGEAPGHIHSAP